MTRSRHFGDIVFDEDFLFATREPGSELKFTRSERAVLMTLAGNARKVMSRNQLLDAIAGVGSDAADRNIDFVINRLRAKLGDSARAPRFIATQYGEGYVWIAEPRQAAPKREELLLAIGPVFGLDRLADAHPAETVLARLHASLAAMAGDGQRVAPAWQRKLHLPAPDARFTLELGFYANGGPLHCAAVLREGRSGRIVKAQRLAFPVAGAADVEELAGSLRAAMWDYHSFGRGPVAALADVPLEVRLHDASLMFTQVPETWIETETHVRRALTDRPHDPDAMLAAAMCIYSRRLMQASTATSEAEDEDDIERLVFASLPRIGDNPILALASAKLLLFVGRGHLPLAEAIAEQAFAESTAFAAAFATLGQIRVCSGDIEAGLDLYERGIELSEAGSEFRNYLMVLSCIAHLASGDRAAVGRSTARFYAVKPQAEANFGILFAPPDETLLPPLLKAILAKLDAEGARLLIRHSYYISARLYEREAHRANIMRGFLTLAVGRFGPGVVPDEVRRSVPKLMAELQI